MRCAAVASPALAVVAILAIALAGCDPGGWKSLESGTTQTLRSVFVEAKDLILHDKFIVPPFRTSYVLDGGAEHLVWQFDQLPGGSDRERYVDDFFIPEMTCGNYNCRRFAIKPSHFSSQPLLGLHRNRQLGPQGP